MPPSLPSFSSSLPLSLALDLVPRATLLVLLTVSPCARVRVSFGLADDNRLRLLRPRHRIGQGILDPLRSGWDPGGGILPGLPRRPNLRRHRGCTRRCDG